MTEWLVALVTLSAMEIVLGIDNVIFIAIVAGRLPPDQQDRARKLGLAVALVTRLLLLFGIALVLRLTHPLFALPDWIFAADEAQQITGKDLVLLVGGLFLIAKSTHEIHAKLEGTGEQAPATASARAGFASIIVQIALLDIVFSLDSVITAVGMVDVAGHPANIWIIVAAMIITVGVMLFFAGPIGRFVERHPTLKILALSFLILIGVLLVAEGLGQHLNKGYIYFAMAFSFTVEMLNLRLRRRERTPLQLHTRRMP